MFQFIIQLTCSFTADICTWLHLAWDLCTVNVVLETSKQCSGGDMSYIGCWSRWLWNVRPHNSTAVSLVLKVKIRDSRSSYLSPVQPSPVTDVLLGPRDLVHLDQTFCEAEMTHSLAHILRPTADSSVLLYSVMMPINSAVSASFSTGSMQ